MFSGRNKNRKSGGFKADLKFSLIFGTIFWITALILYAFVFVFIYTNLRNDSRSGIQVRMLGYWALEQSEGLESLTANIDINMILSGEKPFFVRIADEFNNTVLLEYPEKWSSFNFEKLEQDLPDPGEFTVLKSSSMQYVLEAGCIPLNDGFYLQVGMADEERRRIMELLSGSFLIALLVLVVLSSTIGFAVSYRFLLPIRDLGRAVKEVSETGSLDSRIVERKKDGELEQLVISFNGMLQRIEDLVFGMKGALDTVAHDLRTPLTRFRMLAEKSLSRSEWESDSEEAESCRAALESAVVESENVLRMMTMLMDISEAETGTLKLNRSDFKPLDRLKELVDVYEFTAEEKKISLGISPDAWDGEINADSDRFRQAVGNLIDNAVKYGKPGGFVMLDIKLSGDLVEIIVEDDGEGISEKALPEIWKRLYRGRSSKDGLGLGLSLVNAIMLSHDGSAAAESEKGKGSVFTLSFPLR